MGLAGLITAMDALYGKTGVVLDEIESKDREEIVEEFLEDALDAYAEREETWVRRSPARSSAT